MTAQQMIELKKKQFLIEQSKQKLIAASRIVLQAHDGGNHISE